MTTMHEQAADAAEQPAPSLAEEVTQLRAAYAELREELAAVRRQRDEAITQAQWLITRVTNAESAIQSLQADTHLEGETVSHDPVDHGLAPIDSAVAIPSQAAAPKPEVGSAGPWLPPDAAPQETMAQEFAALAEPAPEVEAADAEEAAPAVPMVGSIDVLPAVGGLRKEIHLRRRR